MNKNIVLSFIIIAAILFGAVMLLQNRNIPLSKTTPPNPIPTTQPLQMALQNNQSSGTITSMPSPTDNPSISPIQANKVTLKTSKGDIVLVLYSQDAPKTVQNFLKKAQSGFYNNLTFHRVEDWVIQGGDPVGNGTGGGNMPTELNSKSFLKGSLGVARGGDIQISNDSQFFIVKSDATWLDKQYTNFGMVESGMDVVEKIQIGDKILGLTITE